MKIAKAYGPRVLLIILAAYVGVIAGAMIYAGDPAVSWHDVSPYALVATVGLAAATPGANLLLFLAVIYSLASVARRWPLWSYSVAVALFASVAYALRSAWQA